MGKATKIVFAVICVLFVVSIFYNTTSLGGDNSLSDAFLLTLAAFLTLAIMSFLYEDNPYYKFAEHLFVGVSAAYWMCMGFWSTIVQNMIPKISTSLSSAFEIEYTGAEIKTIVLLYVAVILGILLLMRLMPQGGWISRWPLAFIVGTTAGLNFVRYLRTDFITQISSTILPLVVNWKGFGSFFSDLSLSATGQMALMASNLIIFIGVFTGLVYFFFSKEHTGVFGKASRVGIWVLMITFGASFGYTVMGRISLLVGRLTFLFRDWLNIIS